MLHEVVRADGPEATRVPKKVSWSSYRLPTRKLATALRDAGGRTVADGAAVSSVSSVADELRKLVELRRDAGVVSDEFAGPEGQVSRQTAFAIIASMSGRSVETRGEYSALARSVSNAVGLARLRRHRARASPPELAAGKRLHGQTPYQTDRHRARRQRSPYQEAVSRTTFVRLGVGSDPSCPSDQPVGAPPGIRTQNLRIKRPGDLAVTRRQELHYVDLSAGSFLSDTHQCHWASGVRHRH